MEGFEAEYAGKKPAVGSDVGAPGQPLCLEDKGSLKELK